MRFLFVLFSPFLVLPTSACINGYARVPGVIVVEEEDHALGGIEINSEELAAYIKERTHACAKKLGHSCNDLVIAHLYAKHWKEAVELSTKLVALYPNEYNVVITHAAALELNGRTAEAIPVMEWALELNPTSHKRSEWIHLNLLKQRLLGESGVDPSALIGVELHRGDSLVAPDTLDLNALLAQLHYQITDRHYFTPEHDPLFGALLFAYADVLRLTNYRSTSARFYTMAKEYGFDREARLAQFHASKTTGDSIDAQTARAVAKEQAEAAPVAKRRSWPLFGGAAMAVILL
ncbi:MAG TPA: hypothetical protein VHL57_02025, partial [Flavobacteriales bacterium]|nr:hypothetical protein [Flavobacteriales bacterium]